MRPYARPHLLCALIVFTGSSPLAVAAPSVQIQKIAYEGDAAPSLQGFEYGFVSTRPSIHQGVVNFSASGTQPIVGGDSFAGFFEWSNGTTSHRFAQIQAEGEPLQPPVPRPIFDLESDVFLFQGHGGLASQQAIYKLQDGAVTPVIQSGMPIPGRDQSVGSLSYVRTDGETIFFTNTRYDEQFNGYASILAADLNGDNIRVLVEEYMPPADQPNNTNNFGMLGEAANGRVVFYSQETDYGPGGGIFSRVQSVDSNGNLDVVIDEHTTHPMTGEPIFPRPASSVSGDTVAFSAYSISGGSGLFSRDVSDGEIKLLLDTTADFPVELTGDPLSISSPSIDGEDFAFIGVWDTHELDLPYNASINLMMQIDGELHRILGTGDKLGGRIVDQLFLGEEGYEAGSVAFVVRFTDRTEGIYYASIPSPGAFVMLLPIGAMPLRRRRKEHAVAASV